ncbi:unnamed protein product, partial [Urochloa humidicola]
DISKSNSRSRGCRLTQHNAGSKAFAQLSYEKRDPETGEEPNDLDLWFMTHTRDGVWTNEPSREVHVKADSLISEKESKAEADGRIVTEKEKNQIFQEAYKQVTKCKSSSKLHGNGYMAVYPTRRQLLNNAYQEKISLEERQHRDHLELMETFGQFKEKMETDQAANEIANEEHRRQLEEVMMLREAERQEFRKEMEAQRADREAERQDYQRQLEEIKKEREADKETLKQEIFSMLAAQGHALFS